MPSLNTFDVKPIGNLVRKYLDKSKISVDPFARDKRWADYTNDINPKTKAACHMDAESFCRMLAERGVVADLILFDPPYSPRQIKECYEGLGRVVTAQDTQNAALYARVRRSMLPLTKMGTIVISCGWNSAGMGKKNGFVVDEILLVAHGGAHNDTIVTVEHKA